MQGHQLVFSLSPSHTHSCTVLPLAHLIVCLPPPASLSTSLSPSFLELAIMADRQIIVAPSNRERRFVLVCTEPPLQVIDPMDPDNFKPPRATIWTIQPAPSISLALLAIRGEVTTTTTVRCSPSFLLLVTE